MRERLQTLSLEKLKEFAKGEGIKGYSSMRKAELIDLLCRKAEEKEGGTAAEAVSSGNQGTVQEQAGHSEKENGEAGEGQAARESQSARESQEALKADAESQQAVKPEPEKQTAENQPAQSQGQRQSYNDKKKTVVRSYRAEGQQRNGNYRQNTDQRQGRQGTDQRQDRQYADQRQDRQYADQRQERQYADQRQDRQYSDQRQDRQDAEQRQNTDQRQFAERQERQNAERFDAQEDFQPSQELQELDSGISAHGILEVMPDGFGFIRCENYLPGENDVYVAPSQIRRFNMKTGDIIQGKRRVKTAAEKFAALLYVTNINGYPTSVAERRPNFENMTPIFPDERLHMETPGIKNTTAMRVLDLLAPIGKGQRGMIVSPPKAGKTTLLKQVAKAVTVNHPEMHVMILLIDERPEEVTDIREAITGDNVEVLYSTFDELPERHKRVSEMVIERAKRLVEHGRDVIILLDSITRLARAYNLTVAPSGRTLSGGLDPAALHMPKRFFGAARNMREGGSLTILATALVDTGSRMDDVIYEEFKGTGNMELVLDRKLSEKRIFPAIDILKSGTRRDDLLLTREEAEAVDIVRKATTTLKPEDAVEKILDLFARTRTNREFVEMSKKIFRY